MKKLVMVDLETLSSDNNASIIAIGAVDNDGREFYSPIDPESSVPYNLHISPSTVKFWLKNSKVYPWDDGQNIVSVLHNFAGWLPKKFELWSHRFDAIVLRSAYQATHVKCPWHYRDERDLRTLASLTKNLCGELVEGMENPQPHNALSDARTQMDALLANLEALRTLKNE